MPIKDFWHNKALFFWTVTFTTEIKTIMAHALQDGSPFSGFQRNAVGA
jgi:hypothetical protein